MYIFIYYNKTYRKQYKYKCMCSFLSYEVGMCLSWFNISSMGRMTKLVTSAYCIKKCTELEQREIKSICELFRIYQSAQLDHQELWFGIAPLDFILPLN